MKYSIIQPLFYRPHREMSRTQAKQYFNWFIENIPKRIETLATAIRTSPDGKYKIWQADHTPGSLDTLGQWFQQHVTIRERTSVELQEDARRLGMSLERALQRDYLEEWMLTEETYSIAIDTGIYLGQVFISDIEGVKWELLTRPKKDVDYQKPVLKGLGSIPCNPIGLTITLAYGFVRNRKTSSELRRLYDYWSSPP